jgi:hypothetical protein
MIITQGFESSIIGSNNRNTLILDGVVGVLNISAALTGLSNVYEFKLTPFDGRVKLELEAITRQLYTKVVNYIDPFDYSGDVTYGTSSAYHFAAMSIVLLDDISQINLSCRVINGSLQIGDGLFTEYLGTALSHLPCPNYTPPANLDPIAFGDTFESQQGLVITGNVMNANPLYADYDPDGDPITVSSYGVGGTTYPFGTTVVIPSVGTVVILANGDMTFTPNGIFIGTYSFNYTITDGNGGSDNAQVDIVISETGIYANQYENQYE